MSLALYDDNIIVLTQTNGTIKKLKEKLSTRKKTEPMRGLLYEKTYRKFPSKGS